MNAPASTPPSPPSPDTPTPLLGGLTPRTFMRRHWQKKPLLIRNAVPGAQPPLDRASLFALAGQEDVESRLIVQQRFAPVKAPAKAAAKASSAGPADAGWSLQHGPFARRALPPLQQPGWTLLVQGLDLHVPAAHELLQRFRFVPDARLDDLMISYATEGGGVGPHYDSYDVFLLQVHGQRRWRIGRLKDDSLQPDVPLKILSNFEPEHEYLLEPGDMLYLPPMWAHDGIAQGECMTCSIGFRVPEATELAREVLIRFVEELDSEAPRRLYRDPKQDATDTPGLVPEALEHFAAEAIERLLKDRDGLRSALGEILTEPKPRVWFEGGESLPEGVGVRLNARTRMVYDGQRVFANGESWRAAGQDARMLRELADQRWLSARTVARASTALRELLDQWSEDGWLHPLP
ncbi:MAG: cupin domain-containing protein [Proteobacteria bacterium]|uniref:JmjC domain-containing protein n=1 Tax=Aquabacterium sp. TaxID=1872578 RepID=UPI0035C7461D|nr:cupin domain-containing protein [Pseudomonadota bacterium]